MPTTDQCDLSDFCRELAGQTDTEYRLTYPDGPPSRTLMATKDYAVLADMSPLMPGHSLVLPRRHELSLAAVVARDADGFHSLLQPFLLRFQEVYPRFSFFEHGSNSGSNPAACVAHAHLHVVPIEASLLRREMEIDGLDLETLGGWSDLAEFANMTTPYYLLGDQDGLGVAQCEVRLPKQYFRVIVGRLLGYDPAACDWAVTIRRDFFLETIRVFSVGMEGEN